MKKSKRLLAALLVMAMMLVCFYGCASKQSETETETSGSETENPASEATETYTLKLSHEMAEGTPEIKAAYMFADNVNEKTNGAVTVKIFPSGQLGDPSTVIESAQLGNVDLVVLPSGNFARYDPIFNLETVPYLYANNDVIVEVLNGSGAAETQKKILNDNGFTLLNEARNYFRGPYRVLVSTKPINSIDDLKGLRMRVFENKNYMAAYEKLGANPMVIGWSDVYMGLQQGLVDAAACAIMNLKGEGFTEVAPYVSIVNEYVSGVLILGASKSFEALPEEYQTVIKECADQFGEDVATLAGETVDADIAEMEANGAVFTDIDTAPFREKLKDWYYSLEENGTLPAGSVDIALSHFN